MTDRRQPPRQQLLFGPIEPEAAPAVRPAAVPPAVQALAAQLPRTLRLGTSSWSFAGWNGLVYAAGTRPAALARHGLGAYAQHPLFRTVGVDRSFYAPVDAAEFAAFAATVPADFRFLVKAFGDLTAPELRGGGANPRWLDAAVATDLVVAPAVQGLGDKLGHLLLQFPPQGRQITRDPPRFAARLHAFLSAFPPSTPWWVELRDRELLTPDYAAALRAAGAGHCHAIHPRLPPLADQCAAVPTAGAVLVRWMLQPGHSYEGAKARYEPFARLVDPDPERRAAVTALCRSALQRQLPVTVVANNKAEGSAPCTLLELARALVGAGGA